MSKTNLSSILNSVSKFTSKHTPEILTGLGIAGMVSTTVLAVRATPKAIRILEDKKAELNTPKLPKIEVVKSCWKCYTPAILTGIVSAACLIGANSVNARRYAALTTAYKLSETALTEYREKVVETIGTKKEQTVRDKVAAEVVQKNPVSNSEVIVTGNGESLCFDPMSSRYFMSSIEKIHKAVNEINRGMIQHILGSASLNDFYDELNIARTEVGDILGWNTDNLLEISISSHITDDGRPAVVIDYITRPVYDYDR
jgi:hypothetical protein